MDKLNRESRSRLMSRIRGKDTKPELLVRRLLHALGYRFRLHVRALPGVPDLVFPSRKKVILIHGCFWHRHRCRRGRSMPSSRVEFWQKKFEGNRRRDKSNRRALRDGGWGVLTLWECQLADADSLAAKLRRFLESEK